MMASFSFTKIAERLERNPLSVSDLPSSVPSGRDYFNQARVIAASCF
jgi:hypothetical protein